MAIDTDNQPSEEEPRAFWKQHDDRIRERNEKYSR